MPVIINLRGTSGSGKSTVVRRVMAKYDVITPVRIEGRRQPEGYICAAFNNKLLAVIGHYETPCGGCDTIKTPNQVYEILHYNLSGGNNILYEGIIIQDDTKRLLALNAEHPVNVIELSTPIEECLAGVQARRDDRGDERPLNPKNTIARADRVHKICNKLRAQGLKIPYLSREEAYQYCKELLTTANKWSTSEDC